MNHNVELEFFVGQEKEGADYDIIGHRWACPAQVDDVYPDILHECKCILAKTDQHAIIRFKEEHTARGSWQSARFDTNVLRPCRTLVPDGQASSAHDWHGVRLRGPLHSADLSDLLIKMKQCVEALQANLVMHIGPSCGLRISLQASGQRMSLIEAKKLTSIVWLVEREMLHPLRRTKDHDAVCDLITSHSVLAAAATAHFAGASADVAKPKDPLLLAILNTHVPSTLLDAASQEQLYRIWGLPKIKDLASELRSSTSDRPLAFALHVYDDDDAESDEADSFRAIAHFDYARLLPEETMPRWTELVLSLGKSMALTPDKFRQLVTNIDYAYHAGATPPSAGASSVAARWEILMLGLGVDEPSNRSWSEILARTSGEE